MQVATFIVQKILLDDIGLRYICATAERFFAVGSVLANMVVTLAEQPSTRLLKHIIRCYLRLSDNPRFARAYFRYFCCFNIFMLNYSMLVRQITAFPLLSRQGMRSSAKLPAGHVERWDIQQLSSCKFQFFDIT